MVAAENNLKVWKQACLEEVKRTGDEWVAKVKVEGQGVKTVRAKVMIDATELGDVAKMCGVKYDIGMESRDDTHEDIAPEKKNNICLLYTSDAADERSRKAEMTRTRILLRKRRIILCRILLMLPY